MTANLNRRMDKLEAMHGLSDSKPVIIFRPERHDHDQVERQAELDRLKTSGKYVIVLSDGDGYAVWNKGQCIVDGGLGHE